MKKFEKRAEWDVRTIERKIAKGEITREAYEVLLKALPEAEESIEINEEKLMHDAGVKIHRSPSAAPIPETDA